MEDNSGGGGGDSDEHHHRAGRVRGQPHPDPHLGRHCNGHTQAAPPSKSSACPVSSSEKCRQVSQTKVEKLKLVAFIREGSPLSSFQALQRYLLQLREKGKPEESESESRKQVARTTERSTQGAIIRTHQKHFSPTRPHLKLPPKNLPSLQPKDLIKTEDKETEEVSKANAATAHTATESVVTIFVSGSVPGVYSTVLSTITATNSPTPVRRRREADVVSGGHLGIAPTPAQHLEATPVHHLTIFPSPVEWQCKPSPVTVTVTEVLACDGSVSLSNGGSDGDSDIE